MRNYKKKKKKNPQKEVDPCKLTRAYQSKTPPLPQRPRDRGPVFRCWMETSSKVFDNLECSQVGTLRGG